MITNNVVIDSFHEKTQLATNWSMYENTMKAHAAQLQSDYDSLVKMLHDEDKAPDQLPELEVPSLDAFTILAVRVIILQHIFFFETMIDIFFSFL